MIIPVGWDCTLLESRHRPRNSDWTLGNAVEHILFGFLASHRKKPSEELTLSRKEVALILRCPYSLTETMRLPSFLWALLGLTAAVLARSQRHESDPGDIEENTQSGTSPFARSEGRMNRCPWQSNTISDTFSCWLCADPSNAFGSMTPSAAPTPSPSSPVLLSTSPPTTAPPASTTEAPTVDDEEEETQEGLENNDRFNPVDGDNGLSTNGIVGVVLGSGALILAAVIIRKRQSDADTQTTPADDSII